MGQAVFVRYRALAKDFLAFEKTWFSHWHDTCTHTAMQHTKQNILRKSTATGALLDMPPLPAAALLAVPWLLFSWPQAPMMQDNEVAVCLLPY